MGRHPIIGCFMLSFGMATSGIEDAMAYLVTAIFISVGICLIGASIRAD